MRQTVTSGVLLGLVVRCELKLDCLGLGMNRSHLWLSSPK